MPQATDAKAVLESPPGPVLQVADLQVRFKQPGTLTHAVDGITFEVRRGETLAVVGESGSGKSVTMLSIMRLNEGAKVETSGAVTYRDRSNLSHDLRASNARQLETIRGREIAMIFQDASASLDPLMTIGDQIAQTVRLHGDVSRVEALRRTTELLALVGIAAPEKRLGSYPHQLSGGQRQRVMIAIALAGGPQLLIADEPTTALDVTIQAQILELLEQVQRERALSIILVTHDLGVVAEMADRVVVMYAGQIVESGAAAGVLAAPRHPYTAALLACLPRLDAGSPTEQEHGFRRAKPGRVPIIQGRFQGCRFRSRCPIAREACSDDVPLVETAAGWYSRCLFWKEAS